MVSGIIPVNQIQDETSRIVDVRIVNRPPSILEQLVKNVLPALVANWGQYVISIESIQIETPTYLGSDHTKWGLLTQPSPDASHQCLP